MNAEDLSLLSLKQKPDFVETPAVRSLTERASSYLGAGYPIHFSGPAGTGKTTLAMHVAAQLGRPVALIHGDDEYGSSDLVGGQLGYRSTPGRRQLYPFGDEDRRIRGQDLGGPPADQCLQVRLHRHL